MHASYTQEMVENQGDFGERFEKLRLGRSYQDLSDAIFESTKIRITPQAMHKWVKQGGGITADNARVVADSFEVSPGWLLFGEGEAPAPKLGDVVLDLPGDKPQQTLDFIEYQIQAGSKFIASEKLASYMTMIDRIRKDLKKRRGGKS